MIAFISTYLSHHQLPFCQQMAALTQQQFCYIACEPIHDYRLKMGYEDLNNRVPYVFKAYESASAMQEAKRICDTCEVLLVGSAPEHYFRDRLRKKKLTLRICERPFKEPFTAGNFVRRSVGMLRHFLPYQNKAYYLLAASAYAANDFLMYGCFRKRIYRWGYFPEIRTYSDSAALMDGKTDNSILWVARMIDCKQPQTVLQLASRLKKDGIPFHLTMIGAGDLEDCVRNEIRARGLTDCIELTGALPPDEVRTRMEQSKIMLFTSDRREGWGAVVNEAMNSGCALVADRAAGSVPFLLEDGKNGCLYSDGDLETAYRKLVLLLRQREQCRQIGLAAYKTVLTQWNAENAAKRLMDVLAHLQKCPNERYYYDSGVCSAAVKQKP